MKKNQYIFVILWFSFFLVGLININFITFNDTHYLFSYNNGTISRSLIGYILASISNGNFIPLISIRLLQITTTFIFGILLSILIYSFLKANYKSSDYLITYLIIISPIGFVILASDFGRLDHINLNLLLIVVLAFLKTPNFYVRLIIMSLLSLTMVLIHEASLILFLPLVVFLIVLDNIDLFKHSLSKLILYLLLIMTFILPTIILTVYIVTQSRIPFSEDVLVILFQRLQSFTDFEISYGAVEIHFTSLENNIFMTIYSFLNYRVFIGYISSIILMLIFNSFQLYNIKRAIQKSLILTDRRIRIILLTVTNLLIFSPLLMSFFGTDHFRWVAITSVNINLIFLYLFSKNNGFLETDYNLSFLDYKGIQLMIILIVFGLLIGPISATTPPVAIRRILGLMFSMID